LSVLGNHKRLTSELLSVGKYMVAPQNALIP